MRQGLRDVDGGQQIIQQIGAEDDQAEQRGIARGGLRAGIQQPQRQLALNGREQRRADDAERRRFRRRRQAGVDRAKDQQHEQQRRDQIDQGPHLDPERQGGRLRQRMAQPVQQDHPDKQAGDEDARQQGGDVERANRGFRDQTVNDEGDPGRDQVAERATRRERA